MNDTDFFDIEKPIDEVTVAELDKLGRVIFERKKEIDQDEESLDIKKGNLHRLQLKMISMLEKFGRSNYQVPGSGMLIKTERVTVALPKTPEDRESFFNYLKEKNLFDHLITVNSQTLNAFYKKEFEVAAEEGRAVGFKIPGISEPKILTMLNVRKGK